jgi:hypothetical protein
LIKFSRPKGLLSRAVRYFLYMGVGLFGIAYELLKSDAVRWPLMAGYALVIGACLYILTTRSHDLADEEEQPGE